MGKQGVYFLSIEGGKRLSCVIAKALSGLPYRYSKTKRNESSFKSYNKDCRDYFEANYRTGPELKIKTELDKWLTERYALFQDTSSSINEFEIHHIEWPLKEIELKKLTLKYNKYDSMIGKKPDMAHYSNGVQIIAWGMNKINKTQNNIN